MVFTAALYQYLTEGLADAVRQHDPYPFKWRLCHRPPLAACTTRAAVKNSRQ